MFSLTVREQLLVATVLLALATGGIIQHLRHRVAPGTTPALSENTTQP